MTIKHEIIRELNVISYLFKNFFTYKIPTPKSWDFFVSHISHFTIKHFTFRVSQFPCYKYEISSKNSITESPYFLKNFGLSDF